jgi:hypothetical protein
MTFTIGYYVWPLTASVVLPIPVYYTLVNTNWTNESQSFRFAARKFNQDLTVAING